MIARDPVTAPPRTDLPWLRLRRPAADPPAPAADPPRIRYVKPPRVPSAAATDPPPIRYVRPPRVPSAATAPPVAPPAPAPADTPLAPPAMASTSLDLEPPAPAPASPTLDLDRPQPGPAPSSLDLEPPPAATTSLDLDPPGTRSSLDLSATTSTPAATPPAAAGLPPPDRARRVHGPEAVLLTPAAPTVTLTRLQSGAGALAVTLAASREVGDVHLGCAYRLVDGPTGPGVSSLVEAGSGLLVAPPGSRRPVLRADPRSGGTLTVDLAQVTRLDRLVVYLRSPSHQTLRWGGTLTVETLGGGRLRMPLDRPTSGGVLVVLSVYAVDGELVLRHEDALVDGSVRAAALAFGFDTITWVDDDTPLL